MGESKYVKSGHMKIYYDNNEIIMKYKIIDPEIILAKLAPLKRGNSETINFIVNPSYGTGSSILDGLQ